MRAAVYTTLMSGRWHVGAERPVVRGNSVPNGIGDSAMVVVIRYETLRGRFSGLNAPLDQFWMGGIIDKYFEQKGVRYWAVWTNPGTK